MEFNHKSVLLDECLESLNINPSGIYIDGTVGGAGHSAQIYKRLNEQGMLIGFDQDKIAINVSHRRLDELKGEAKFQLFNNNFTEIKNICETNNIPEVSGILMDLGVSSYQLDTAERGFSYQHDAKLDMRMDDQNSLTAHTIVNEYSKEDLKRIIYEYGEEKWASRIADFIVTKRQNEKIETTLQLVNVIKAAIPAGARQEGSHPAKRTFQAIRIEVNNELGILSKAIQNSVSVLKSGGRLCIITFHSLEDRIVKNEFAKLANPCTCPSKFPICVCESKATVKVITRKPIVPTKEELEENPRSRSAKLRVLEKL